MMIIKPMYIVVHFMRCNKRSFAVINHFHVRARVLNAIFFARRAKINIVIIFLIIRSRGGVVNVAHSSRSMKFYKLRR